MFQFLSSNANGVCIQVKLQPRASRNEIGELIGSELKIRVTAPPVDAAANQALVRILADLLGCSKGSIQLIRGQTSRHKVILITGATIDAVAEKIKNASGVA